MSDTEPRPHPAERVAAAVARWGEPAVARRGAALLAGGTDRDLVEALGGRAALDDLDRNPVNGYWARVWGTRALRYAWDDAVAPDVVDALADPHWRVREMAAKVTALRELGAAGDRLVPLLSDPVPRVRSAAARALGLVGEAEHAGPLRDAADDPDTAVRRAADRALDGLSRRLDRDLSGD